MLDCEREYLVVVCYINSAYELDSRHFKLYNILAAIQIDAFWGNIKELLEFADEGKLIGVYCTSGRGVIVAV